MLDSYADRWALVTGASSGIGAAIARRLAARGMHLVLTARRAELLESLAAELHTQHATRCEIITADLSNPEEPKRLIDQIAARGVTIELLVNNAGFGVVGDVESTSVDRMLELLRVNALAVTELTYRVLPGMLQRGHGAVINVASVAAFQPVAYMGVYSATKTYVLHFSEALWAETKDRGVTVMALCPGVTQTSFFDNAGVPGWLKKQRSQSPDQVAKAALKGLEKKRQYWISGWINYWLSLAVRIASRRIVVTETIKYFRPTSGKKSRKSSAESPR